MPGSRNCPPWVSADRAIAPPSGTLIVMSALWFAPLAVGAAGAVAAVVLSRALGRDVAKLQASLRPLRTRGTPRRTGPGRSYNRPGRSL
jgi:hypothetical protein